MGVLKSVEPTGFLAFAPAFAGTIWADVNRRIIQNCPHGRGRRLPSPPVWFRLCRLRVWGVLNGYRPKGQTNWSKALVRHGAGAREAITALPEVPAGGHSGPRPPAIEHPASHPRQSQQWPGAALGIAPSTAIVASAPIRAVPTPGGTPASVVRTSPARVWTLAVIPVRRAMRRNPFAPPSAPMTGYRVPTRAAATPHLYDAGRGAHPDRSLA